MCCMMALAESDVRTDAEEEPQKHKDGPEPTPVYLFIETDINSIKIALSHLHFDLHIKREGYASVGSVRMMEISGGKQEPVLPWASGKFYCSLKRFEYISKRKSLTFW